MKSIYRARPLLFLTIVAFNLLFLLLNLNTEGPDDPKLCLGDATTPLDLRSSPTFDYLTQDNDVCKSQPPSGPAFLVLVVGSAAENVQQRALIRDTWGQKDRLHSVGARLVFVVGESPLVANEAIATESRLHGDVVQRQFADTYCNLTLKTSLMLQWQQQRCAQASFVLKCDDNVFINVANFVAYLQQMKASLNRTVVGYRHRWAQSPSRAWLRWWGTSYYPDYVSGSAYVLSRDLVAPLLTASSDVAPVQFEDVYFTGLLREHVQARIQHEEMIKFSRTEFTDMCVFERLLAVHRVTSDEIRQIWSHLSRGRCHQQQQQQQRQI